MLRGHKLLLPNRSTINIYIVPNIYTSKYYRQCYDPEWCDYDENIYLEIFDMYDITTINVYGNAIQMEKHTYCEKMISNVTHAILQCSKKGNVKCHCSFCHSEIYLEKESDFICCDDCLETHFDKNGKIKDKDRIIINGKYRDHINIRTPLIKGIK